LLVSQPTAVTARASDHPTGTHHLSREQAITSSLDQLPLAGILLQTLFFTSVKFHD
jgi:hypothetical protein